MRLQSSPLNERNGYPFRFARRIPQVRKTAAYMATLDHTHAEGHLRDQLRRLDHSLRVKGVADHLIRSEVAAYEAAIRAMSGVS